MDYEEEDKKESITTLWHNYIFNLPGSYLNNGEAIS